MLTKFSACCFFLFATVLIIVPRLLKWNELDIHIHDTYFVLKSSYLIFNSLAFLMLIFAAAYQWGSKLFPVPWLMLIHVVFTFVSLFIVLKLILWDYRVQMPAGYVDYSGYRENVTSSARAMLYGYVSALLFPGGQLAFLCNGIAGLIRRRRSKNGIGGPSH